MVAQCKYLVVGGDSLIGDRLAQELLIYGDVRKTGRKFGFDNQIRLDLVSHDFSAAIKYAPNVAFICAGITDIQTCELDPLGTRKVNVAGIVRLANELLSIGCFIVFLSSSAVFDGLTPYPNEDSVQSPTVEYGRQKAEVESLLLTNGSYSNQIAIVRLTKVVTPNGGMVANFIGHLRNRIKITPFCDLSLSPVTLDYACAVITKIGVQKHSGIYHLSGDSELTYAEFAILLAEGLSCPKWLIVDALSNEVGVNVLFRPKNPALGMQRTKRILGVTAEPLADLIGKLY